MQISVIIPTRNEAAEIQSAVASARDAERPPSAPGRPRVTVEIIVADGRSDDGTAEIARRLGVRVIGSPPGRGVQLRAGAAAATGDVLLFLHADARFPPDYAREALDLLGRPGVVAGAFRLRIDAPRRSLRLIERTVNWRSRVLQMPYGDQALFMTREVYDRAGGFARLPVMEDYVLVRRLRRMGRIAISSAAVTTSARRWLRYGVWRTTLLNQACIVAYCIGASAERIAGWRNRL